MIISKLLTRCVLALSLTAVATSPAAWAKTKTKAEALRLQAQRLCVDDATRLCDEFVTDDAKTFACLGEHQDELSPACRKVYDAATVKAKPK